MLTPYKIARRLHRRHIRRIACKNPEWQAIESRPGLTVDFRDVMRQHEIEEALGVKEPWMMRFLWHLEPDAHLSLHPARWSQNIKARWERSRDGYSSRELSYFDSYIAELMEKAIREIAEKSYSYPGDVESMEDWRDILDKIAKGFHAMAKLSEVYDPEERKQLKATFTDGMTLFTEWHDALNT